MTDQPKTKSAQIRALIAECGPMTSAQLAAVYPDYWQLCGAMIKTGLLIRDESGAFLIGRQPRPSHGQRVDPAPRMARERERLRARNEREKAERAKLRQDRVKPQAGPLIRVRQQREVSNKNAERALAAQAMRRRECGLVDRPEPPKMQTVEEWMASTGQTPEVLRAGEVSKASQFKRIVVA